MFNTYVNRVIGNMLNTIRQDFQALHKDGFGLHKMKSCHDSENL